MLTSKQIKEELPKGTYSNIRLAAKFPNHGKKNRQVTLPVDQFGKVVDVMSSKFVRMQTMRLNRQQSRRYS